MKVYQAINKVQADLARTGISKDRTNTQGSGYKFRGIDDVFNALSPYWQPTAFAYCRGC